MQVCSVATNVSMSLDVCCGVCVVEVYAECEPGVDLAICMKKLFFRGILDRNGENHVGIEYVEDNNICMATVGRDGEAASLICEEVAIDFIDGNENKMCACVVGFLRDILHGIIDNVRQPNWLGCWIMKMGLGGSDTLAISIHVSHFRFCGDRDVAACPL